MPCNTKERRFNYGYEDNSNPYYEQRPPGWFWNSDSDDCQQREDHQDESQNDLPSVNSEKIWKEGGEISVGKNTKQTSAKVAKVASKILRDGRYSPSAKEAALCLRLLGKNTNK